MQINKIETSKKIRFLDMQVDTLKKSKARLEITDTEVSTLTPDTKVYAAVGRMFVLSTVPELHTELQEKSKKITEVIRQCDTNKDFMLKNLKEQEDSLRELVQTKKDMKWNVFRFFFDK